MFKTVLISVVISVSVRITAAKLKLSTVEHNFVISSNNDDIIDVTDEICLRRQRNLRQDIKDIMYDEYNNSKIQSPNSTEPEQCVGDPQFCNMTKEDYLQMLNEYIYPQTYEWVLIGTHTVVFVIGLLGNSLVCVAVYRNHTMRTVTNYFLVNLAVADIMVLLFCLPATVLWDVTETWFLGDVLCKILLFFQSVSVTVSVLTLAFISVDRWYAICFPLKFKSTISRAKTAIFVIWAVSLIFNLKLKKGMSEISCGTLLYMHAQFAFIITQAREGFVNLFKTIFERLNLFLIFIVCLSLFFLYIYLDTPELVVLTTVKMVPLRFELEYLIQCMPTWSSKSDLVWHIFKILFIYTIPLVLMTIAYHQIVRVLWSSQKIPGLAETIKLASAEQIQLRSRRKAAKMLVAVVIMFAVCYFPVHLLSVLRYMDMEQNDVITCFALASHVLCYANSAINPLIYNFMSSKYRREFRRAFCCTQSITRDTFTTMTRLTTSRKKYEMSDKTYRCSSVQFHHCENVSLRSHNCEMTFKSHNCQRMCFNDRSCEHFRSSQRCNHSCDVILTNGQRYCNNAIDLYSK